MAPEVKVGQRWLVEDLPKRKFIIEVLSNFQHKVVQHFVGEYHVGYVGCWALNYHDRVFTLLEGQEAPMEN